MKEHQAGMSAMDLCSKNGFSDATFYIKWRSKYGGMGVSDARRLKSLGDENRKRGVFVSPSGVRSIWLRNDLANFKTRLKALEAKVAAEGIILTEALEEGKAIWKEKFIG